MSYEGSTAACGHRAQAVQQGRSRVGEDSVLVLLSGTNSRGHGPHGPRTPRERAEVGSSKEQVLLQTLARNTVAAAPDKATRSESVPTVGPPVKQRVTAQQLNQRHSVTGVPEGPASPARRAAPPVRSAACIRSRSLPGDPAMISEQILKELRSSLAAAAGAKATVKEESQLSMAGYNGRNTTQNTNSEPIKAPQPMSNKDDAIIQVKKQAQKASQKAAANVLQNGGGDHCVWCIRPRALMVCAGCDTARYCNERCQKAHWPEHRKECVQPPKKECPRPPKKAPGLPEPAPAG